jgi:hypothetical protein
MPLASSTVMTPSLPTFSMASARILPMSGSPLAEMVPTCAISRWSLVGGRDIACSAVTIGAHGAVDAALDVHRVVPAATILRPSR